MVKKFINKIMKNIIKLFKKKKKLFISLGTKIVFYLKNYDV